ncbi:hypothetical protein [Brevundimonas sp.]
MKSVALVAAVATAFLVPLPVQAQDVDPAMVLSRVCMPYAGRSASFERAMRHAEDLRFGRPPNSAPMEEYASEVDMVSRDGIWRIRLEEGTVTRGDRDVYAVTCSLSSKRASANELGLLIDRALSGHPRWTRGGGGARWQRLYADDTSMVIDVNEPEGQRPALGVTGLYP